MASVVRGRNPRKNAEGYSDPTAYEAIRRVSLQEGDAYDSIIIARRQREYLAGTRLRIIEMRDKNLSRFNGRIAKVDFVDDLGYIFVLLRNEEKGLRLSGLDKFEKI